MCNPFELLCSCLGCPPPNRGFLTETLKMTDREAQGITEFFGEICDKLGCTERQSRGQMTLLAVAHKNTVEALVNTYPEAKACIPENVQGVFNAFGDMCVNPQDPAGTQKLFSAIGGLLACILGPERAKEIRLNMYERAIPQVANFRLRPQATGNPIFDCLLNLLMGQLCPQPVNPPPQPPPQGGGCCPPIGGGSPPTQELPTPATTDRNC